MTGDTLSRLCAAMARDIAAALMNCGRAPIIAAIFISASFGGQVFKFSVLEKWKAGRDGCYLPKESFVVIVIAYPKPRNRISIEHAQRSHT